MMQALMDDGCVSSSRQTPIKLFVGSMLDNITPPNTMTVTMNLFGHTSGLTKRRECAPLLVCVIRYWGASLPQADSSNLEGTT